MQAGRWGGWFLNRFVTAPYAVYKPEEDIILLQRLTD